MGLDFLYSFIPLPVHHPQQAIETVGDRRVLVGTRKQAAACREKYSKNRICDFGKNFLENIANLRKPNLN